jgi:hypothetical protein
MKSIVVTYPDFQKLPKGLKQMLVASESFFFDQMKTGAVPDRGNGKLTAPRWSNGLEWLRSQPPLHRNWRN